VLLSTGIFQQLLTLQHRHNKVPPVAIFWSC